jgi:hypothetical protein
MRDEDWSYRTAEVRLLEQVERRGALALARAGPRARWPSRAPDDPTR